MKLNYFKRLTLLLFALMIISAQSFAHFGSKGPFGGDVSCSITHDTTVYIGTLNGGVFESTNSKLISWRARPVGLKSGKITALAHSGKYLFAGTADSGIYIFNGYVGSDRYWNKVNNGLYDLKITSLVALDSITIVAGTKTAVYITTNKGATWTFINNSVMHHYNITALVKAGNRIIHSSFDGGIYGSDDKGASWIDLNDMKLTHVNGLTLISYNAGTDELLISNQNGIYKAASASTASKPTITEQSTGLPPGIAVRSMSNDGTNWYLATDMGVYSSLINSINWTSINTGLTTNNVTSVTSMQGKLVCGTDKEGIFKATIPFTSWAAMNSNFNNIVTYSMATSGANMVAAATDRGVFVSSDLAASFKRSNHGLTDSLNVTDLEFSGTKLFASTKNAGVFMSLDSGKIWTSVNAGLGNMNVRKIFVAGDDIYLFGADDKIYQSLISNINWINIQSGLGDATPSSLTHFGTKVLLGTLGNGVFIKSRYANSWTPSDNGLADLKITSVAVSGKKMFIGTDSSGVYVSDTSNVNWTTASKIAINHISLMALNPKKIQAMNSNAGYVFASYKGGLVASSDNGATWIEGGNQFNLPSFTDVTKISFTTARVFVSTQNNSLYSNGLSELPPITGIEKESNSSKINLYPNPNTGTFTIDLKDLNEKDILASFFDVTGKLIETRSIQKTTTLELNYPKGIYFVQVKTSKATVTKKMIIE